MDDPDVLTVLRSIDRRLALLSGQEDRGIRKALAEAILTTPARILMWDGIDGRTGSPDLAKTAKVSERAAQAFAKELLDSGLVKAVASARGTVVAKDDDAIVQWYLRRLAMAAE